MRVLGIDSSPDMIASARKLHPDCDFDVLDAGSLDELDTDFDVVFSNACLQWVPNHERVLPSMLRRLNAGGLTSAQFTENINLPPHIIMRETACEPKWRQWISEIRRYCNLGGDNFDVSAYYDLLAPLSAHVDVWETNYYHALPGYEAILDWYRGTGLRPYLAQLPDDGLYLRIRAGGSGAHPRSLPAAGRRYGADRVPSLLLPCPDVTMTLSKLADTGRFSSKTACICEF